MSDLEALGASAQTGFAAGKARETVIVVVEVVQAVVDLKVIFG